MLPAKKFPRTNRALLLRCIPSQAALHLFGEIFRFLTEKSGPSNLGSTQIHTLQQLRDRNRLFRTSLNLWCHRRDRRQPRRHKKSLAWRHTSSLYPPQQPYPHASRVWATHNGGLPWLQYRWLCLPSWYAQSLLSFLVQWSSWSKSPSDKHICYLNH